MNNVLLLDGYNLIYRARHSGMNKGEFSTIFNFFRSIRPLVEKFNPDLCYFVLEGMPVKRLEVAPEYKAQRVYHDKDNFRSQRKKIISLIKEFFPFTIARHSDYECDDVINFLANEKHKNDNVTIISSDTDFIQSINEKTKVYNPVRKLFQDETEYNYVEWKALVGDKSDNIEGFKGVGNKTAIKLLNDSNKLNDFLLQEGFKEKFNKNKFMIRFHDLTEEKLNIEYTLPQNPNWNNLKNEFINMQFSSIISKDKSWNKYINTFQNLERNIEDVNRRSS